MYLMVRGLRYGCCSAMHASVVAMSALLAVLLPLRASGLLLQRLWLLATPYNYTQPARLCEMSSVQNATTRSAHECHAGFDQLTAANFARTRYAKRLKLCTKLATVQLRECSYFYNLMFCLLLQW